MRPLDVIECFPTSRTAALISHAAFTVGNGERIAQRKTPTSDDLAASEPYDRPASHWLSEHAIRGRWVTGGSGVADQVSARDASTNDPAALASMLLIVPVPHLL